MKCLLIETRDRRKFFTHEKNFGPLIEFCKSFKANIMLVNMTGGELLTLEELAPAICSPQPKNSKVQYEILGTMLTARQNTRNKILAHSEKIQNHITKTFLAGEVVDLKRLKNKFKTFGLSDAALCNHMKKSRDRLVADGHKVEKVGAGKYRIVP